MAANDKELDREALLLLAALLETMVGSPVAKKLGHIQPKFSVTTAQKLANTLRRTGEDL